MLILCGFVLTNAQQTYTVEGTVQDFHDKTMLENASVKIGDFSAKQIKTVSFQLIKFLQENIYSLLNILIVMIILKI
jgi:iron complex outermembrane receptor protein